jgi:hypothetical protein
MSDRARIAARWVGPGSRVLDLGCGEQVLRDLLPANCIYVPADLQARTPDTIVVDLNLGQFPDGQYDVTAVLGVLEYMSEPHALLMRIAESSPRLLISYTTKRFTRRRTGQAIDRLNYFSSREMRALLATSGWIMERRTCIDRHFRLHGQQELYVCRR